MMRISLAVILFIFSALNVSGQSTGNSPAKEHITPTTPFEDYLKGYYSQIFGISTSDIFDLNLYNVIEKWLGTPYRYAGKTLSGIDCSAFVNKIYEAAFCCLLEGNSANMYKQVEHIRKDELTEGDLVFFRINRNKTISHVGVYLGNNKFAHASRSNGVIISDLNSPYYKKHFVKGGRVDFQAH
jgi:murein DD-endopeptidase / murein LD-carboxypeptidase